MIKDRGNKKWVSLMLTEHRRALKKLKKEEKLAQKPQLDSGLLREMDYLFQEALYKNKTVRVKYYEKQKIKEITGKINKYNLVIKEIMIGDKVLTVNSIVDLEL